MSYFRNTFVMLVLLLIGSIGALALSTTWLHGLNTANRDLQKRLWLEKQQQAKLESESLRLEQRLLPVRSFVAAWEPYLHPGDAKDLGEIIRGGLAASATQHGLTSEGAVVSRDAKPLALGGFTFTLQKVSLKVIGPTVPPLIAWLGAAEERFPYARIESLSLSAYGSRSVQLSITLSHPIEESLSSSGHQYAEK